MLAKSFKRTKIVASIGPATHSAAAIERLAAAGANAVRLNLSHDSHQAHAQRLKWARAASGRLGKPLAVIMDLQGPKIRVGELPAEGVDLVAGQTVRFAYGANFSDSGLIPIQYDFSTKVRPGELVSLYDGRMQTVIEAVHQGVVTATVKVGGNLISRKGINLPDTDFSGDILTIKDIGDIAFAAAHDVDFIALSFVQRAEDVSGLRDKLRQLGSDAAVIAKIETRLGVRNLPAITKVSDAVMVARGDLAVEIPPEQVPVVQQQAVRLGQRYQKPVIVATQMLASMAGSPQPTRAEVSDVATAVMQGADCVMLSEETTIGEYPVLAVEMMKRVINYTQEFATLHRPVVEQFSDQGALTPGLFAAAPAGGQPAGGEQPSLSLQQQKAIPASAILLARQVGAKVILAETASGQTARNLAALRPPMPIMMVTHQRRVYHQLAIVWGGKAFCVNDPKRAGAEVVEQLKQAGNVVAGDFIVVASGHRSGVTGGTDTIRVKVV
ncbi:pyruvate kinase [Candidatus Parcubacteria bacterium]|nr:pyruvate kinase [Candidatus Parcubacteria bacterium]